MLFGRSINVYLSNLSNQATPLIRTLDLCHFGGVIKCFLLYSKEYYFNFAVVPRSIFYS